MSGFNTNAGSVIQAPGVVAQRPKLNIPVKTYEHKTETESDSSRSGFSPDPAVADPFSLSQSTRGDTTRGHAFAKKVAYSVS